MRALEIVIETGSGARRCLNRARDAAIRKSGFSLPQSGYLCPRSVNHQHEGCPSQLAIRRNRRGAPRSKMASASGSSSPRICAPNRS